ncbi:Scavenger receptor class A member 5 [Liparis tanakae]|uniref:Scavenger receptor class A member 5 n=1 Tax=Liparis tanakae TaxID=230148 RepID=A0A4Z2HDQ1_9TELE|nr:Scavenger receptor class A member 5 [Liparis tanakae]
MELQEGKPNIHFSRMKSTDFPQLFNTINATETAKALTTGSPEFLSSSLDDTNRKSNTSISNSIVVWILTDDPDFNSRPTKTSRQEMENKAMYLSTYEERESGSMYEEAYEGNTLSKLNLCDEGKEGSCEAVTGTHSQARLGGERDKWNSFY